MYQLYNPQTTYMLPNGEVGTNERLLQDFPLCGSVPYACVADDGVLSEMTRLSVLKTVYGIDEDDNEAAVAAINALRAETSPDVTTLSGVAQQVTDLQLALVELYEATI